MHNKGENQEVPGEVLNAFERFYFNIGTSPDQMLNLLSNLQDIGHRPRALYYMYQLSHYRPAQLMALLDHIIYSMADHGAEIPDEQRPQVGRLAMLVAGMLPLAEDE